jgi:hypothetical protein
MKTMAFKNTCVAVLIMAAFSFYSGCDYNNGLPRIGDRVRTSANLVSLPSCTDLEQRLKDNLSEEMRAYLLSLADGNFYYLPREDAADMPGSFDSGGRQEGVDYSGTNNQETGADEADLLKTDGYYMYTLNGSELFIVGIPEFGQIGATARLAIEGYPGEILLAKETPDGRAVKAAVFSSIYTYELDEKHPLADRITSDDSIGYYPSAVLTKITVVDLADALNPRVARQFYLEGSYQTAREIDGSVHMLAYSSVEPYGLLYWPELPEAYYLLPYDDPLRKQMWTNAIASAIEHNDELIAGLTLKDLVPKMFEVNGEGEIIPYEETAQGCGNFVIAEDGASRGFTSIASFNLLGSEINFASDHIVSNWSLIYASTDTLLIAEPAQDWWWYYDTEDLDEATNIHRFDISSPGEAVYTGSGRVNGTVLSQFSLSEYEGYVRVATTTGQWNRWWVESPPPTENHVNVLGGDDKLDIVGQIDGIAVDETIWSARFMGEKAFLTTARIIDPLWTIDLSDPANPHIIGSLEVPGVSTYLHPIADDRLLTIGLGGDETGFDGSIKVSLFDVSDFANPVLKSTYTLSAVEGDDWSSWGSSEATYQHKAFQYWAPRKLLAVPLSTSRYKCADDYYCDYEYVSKLALITVDVDQGLSLYGNIDHSSFYNSDPSSYWCYQDIRRSIFMGDYLYAMSDRGITASDLDSLNQTASLNLPGSNCGVYWDEVEPVEKRVMD